MNFIYIASSVIGIVVVLVFIYCNNKTIDLTNKRIDGLHERMDTLRDMMMQRFDNDIKEIKYRLSKEIG
jgi:hypothetical protein